jgi:ABC-type glycerol-3-phosphate transport system permease component
MDPGPSAQHRHPSRGVVVDFGLLWIPHPTLQYYRIVLQQQILNYLEDSAIISVTTVAICILVGIPTSYVIVSGRLKRADNLLFRVLGLLDVPREILESADIDGASR